ncbi:hypothetical protein pipiens_019921 [Culex pipiens pipiens]|uniref:Uncharacterized protein n=1 Tax=Culex pipiens pipiens TaxID=38569 RepID=A0ABD1DR21_CULPP
MNPTVVVLVVATVACLAVLNQPAAAIEAAIPQRSLDLLEPGVTPPWSARKPGMEPAIVTTEQRKPAVLHEAATAEEDSGKEKGKQEKKKCIKGNKLGIWNVMKTALMKNQLPLKQTATSVKRKGSAKASTVQASEREQGAKKDSINDNS